MSLSGLSLPYDVPWQLIAVSPDMMDPTFCSKKSPFVWRSSLAISVFEPSDEDLPERYCDKRLTYLKVSATITGYEPTEEETKLGYVSLPNVPTEQLDRIFRDYFACYGALLQVAVFGGPDAGKTVSTLTRSDIDFAANAPGTSGPNPLTVAGVTFARPSVSATGFVDRYPAGGDGRGELDLGSRLEITMAAKARVTARVVTLGGPVTMEVFQGTKLAKVVQSPPVQGTVHELTVDADGITGVVLHTQSAEASLLSLSTWTRSVRPATPADQPHIIDFEPKNRDLYQVSSENGELLTGSSSKVLIDKTMGHTDSTEFEISKGIEYTSPESSYGQFTGTNNFKPKWGWSNSDSSTVTTDGSRDRRERYGSTTTITQMYNLLTGYHVGTNRAVFLMLPRPHVLQPTPRRTFARGLRVIEGIQEFFLVVERGAGVEGLCIEARLETGHFPEHVDIKVPPPKYTETSQDFSVTATARGGSGADAAMWARLEDQPSATYRAPGGWIIDRFKGDSGHPGVREWADNSNQQAKDSLTMYNYLAVDDSTVKVSGIISGGWNAGGGHPAEFNRTYRVFLRSEHPEKSDEQPTASTETLLITGRNLCVCYRSVDGCPEVVGASDPTPGNQVSIVDEPIVTVPGVNSEGVAAATLRSVRTAMINSWRMPSRRPPGAVGFLESNYFAQRIAPYVPESDAGAPLSAVAKSLPSPVAEQTSVAELLTGDLGRLSARSGIDVAELARLRRRALRLPPAQPGPTAGDRA